MKFNGFLARLLQGSASLVLVTCILGPGTTQAKVLESPTAWKPVLEALTEYFDRFGPTAHSKGWSCLNFEHRLTQWDHAYRHIPLATVLITADRFSDTPELAEDISDTLKLCSTRYPSLQVYTQITRFMLLKDVAADDVQSFLIHYLNYFYPHNPKHIRTHKYLLRDLHRLPAPLKRTSTYKLAVHLFQGVLRPQQLFKVKSQFSSVFYDLLESQIWKIHFEYEKAFRVLARVAPQWLAPNDAKQKVIAQLTDAEKFHLQHRHPNVLRYHQWLIDRLEWLAKRLNTPESQKQAQVLVAPIKNHAFTTPPEEVDQRWQDIRRLWNDHQTQAAVMRAQNHLTWLQDLPTRLHKSKKIKEAFATTYLALAKMNLELGQYKLSFDFFDQAAPWCDSSTDSCFATFYRELTLAYILTQQFSRAYETIRVLTEQSSSEEYNKQEYYFWQWILARQLRIPFVYDFPYLTYYRYLFACMDPSVPFRVPRLTTPDYAPLSRHDISKFFPRKETWFLHQALQKNEHSATITHYLRLMTYQIMGRLAADRPLRLSTPKLMTFVKTLQNHDLYVESAGILYELSKQTPVNHLPQTFYTLFFPSRFASEVRGVGKHLNLSPALLSAFIRRESIFDPIALSPAYALGLMQVLPETAKRVAVGNHIPYQPVADGMVGLFQTHNNILIGSYYIKNLLNYFSGNLIYTLASYNAGENRVETWLKRLEGLQNSPLLFIENIPFSETRFYVKWVLFHYLHYEWLYGDRGNAKKTFCQYIRDPLMTSTTKVANK